MEKDAMEESLIDNSKPTTDRCDMQGQNPWLKEVKTTGYSFVKRGIAMVVILLAAAAAIAYCSDNQWIMVPAVISALYTLAVVVATGLV